MPSEEILKLAEELKEAREKAEISLQQIASKTRIDLKFLQAIEEGNFDILPEVYIRAFIKEYAVHCELDPQKILAKYELAKQGKSINLNASDEVEEKKVSEKKKQFTDESSTVKSDNVSTTNRKKVILYSIVALIATAIIAVYFIFIKNSAPDIVVEKPFDQVLTQQKQRYELTESEEPKQITAETDSLKLNISATDTCWVNVTIDEKIEREYMLYKNTSISVNAAKRFDLIVGNAGGINIILNDSLVNINGSQGQRKIFSINKNGLIKSSN